MLLINLITIYNQKQLQFFYDNYFFKNAANEKFYGKNSLIKIIISTKIKTKIWTQRPT